MSWVAIFKAGKQTDSAGRAREWTVEELKEVVAGYDPEWHEAPVVVGHPEDDAPAYGWVEKLRVVGDVLMAKLKDLDPGFVELLKKRRYAHVSASFYGLKEGGFYLRHLGFLGAAPPAVKGLAQAKFREGEEVMTYEYDEHRIPLVGRVLGRIRDLIIEKYGLETADRVIYPYDLEELQRIEEPQAPAYTDQQPVGAPLAAPAEKEEDDMTEEERKQVEEETRRKVEGEFNEKLTAQETAHTEKLKGKEEDLQSKDEELEDLRKSRRADDIKVFLEPLKKEGRVIPAMEEAGIISFMEHLEDHPPLNDKGQEVAVSFAESKEKQSPANWFREFLKGLPVQVDFKERAAKDAEHQEPEGDTAEKKLISLAKHKEKEDEISFGEAFKQVRDENPELYEQYEEEKKS